MKIIHQKIKMNMTQFIKIKIHRLITVKNIGVL